MFTQQWYMCRQLASRIRMFHPDPARKLSANLYNIHHCCVYSENLLTVYFIFIMLLQEFQDSLNFILSSAFVKHLLHLTLSNQNLVRNFVCSHAFYTFQ